MHVLILIFLLLFRAKKNSSDPIYFLAIFDFAGG